MQAISSWSPCPAICRSLPGRPLATQLPGSLLPRLHLVTVVHFQMGLLGILGGVDGVSVLLGAGKSTLVLLTQILTWESSFSLVTPRPGSAIGPGCTACHIGNCHCGSEEHRGRPAPTPHPCSGPLAPHSSSFCPTRTLDASWYPVLALRVGSPPSAPFFCLRPPPLPSHSPFLVSLQPQAFLLQKHRVPLGGPGM